MDLSYHPRPFAFGWDIRRLLGIRSLPWLAACICWFLAAWLKVGVVLAVSSAVVGVVLAVVLRVRSGRVAIVADDRQICSIGWSSELRWPWDTVASFDYVPHRWRCTPTTFSIGTLYTGRVTLANGTTHLIPALIGSSTGVKESDAVNHRIIGDLSTELDRRRAVTTA